MRGSHDGECQKAQIFCLILQLIWRIAGSVGSCGGREPAFSHLPPSNSSSLKGAAKAELPS
jgi:hypothetical protein